MKKGFIYTSIVIIFLTIMISMFYGYELYKAGDKDDSIETRILTMNDFIKDLKMDTERAAYISGFRTFIALEEYVSTTGEFLADLEASFIEAFVNGSIDNISFSILVDSAFSSYITKVNQKSSDIDLTMSITIIHVNFSHLDPWNVKVEVMSEVSIDDNKGLASWKFNETFTSNIPITDLKDPLYSVNTLGRMQAFIVNTSITEFVIDNQTDNLLEHITEGYYVANPNAPSFLKRFKGDLSSDPNGIESLVDIDFLEEQDDIVVDYTRSVVDYIYFGNQSTANKCSVQNMPSWFRIDDGHLSDYEIDELTYSSC